MPHTPSSAGTGAVGQPGGRETGPTALPSVGARAVAFVTIVVGGLCGGLIGRALVNLQCEKGCATAAGLATVAGAVSAAGGVAVVAVLVLRAMGEWRAVPEGRRRPPR